MKLSIGRTIIVKGIQSNGSDVHPAIVNRAWSGKDTKDGPVMANATVFPDCGAPVCQTSIYVYDSFEAARAAGASGVFAYWPARE